MASSEPQCSTCQATSSPMWRRNEEGATICLECHSLLKKQDKEMKEKVPDSNTHAQFSRKRKGNKRSTKGDKGKGGVSRSSNSPVVGNRGQQQGRRSLFKSKPIQAPTPETEVITTDSVFFKGLAYEVGDVVSILDYSGGTYYAIIRGFLIDQYSDKYAVLTWVLPKTPYPVEFDPRNFILGPEEEEPRKLETLEFVCHSPRSLSFTSSCQYDLEQIHLWLPDR